MKLFADQIRPFVPKGRTYKVLGTDGFGRSDFRYRLREHFEVDRHIVVVGALSALADDGVIPRSKATEAIRKALSMGADKAVHVKDDAIHGSDILQTAWVLARALGQIEGAELVITGNASSDGAGGAVPAIVAEYLGLPQLTHVRKLAVDGDTVTAERETDDGVFGLSATLPAIVSVGEKINEPRFPSFKGIMAAKKKEVVELSLADLGVEADEVGLANAGSSVVSSTPRPPKSAGEKIADEGEGGTKIAEYLVAQKLI